MKPAITAVLAVLLTLASADAALGKPKRGDKEVSASAAFSSNHFESGGSWRKFTISGRLGVFLTDRFEIEPELTVAAQTNTDALVMLSGNLVYNIVPGDPEGTTVPFLLAGLGFSAELPLAAYNEYVFSGFCPEEDVWTVFNAGAGVRTFMSKRVALRFEYRYRGFFGNCDLTEHSGLFGVSAFF